MPKYNIEELSIDHPALLTGNFEACAIAICRRYATGRAWDGQIDCQSLPRGGTGNQALEVQWKANSETDAAKAENTYQANRLTEDAAVGLSATAFAAFHEGEITEVTLRGSGVDYWIDNRRAVLEVSGIETGKAGALSTRHAEKVRQLQGGALFQAGYRGYVFVVHFADKRAVFSFH